MKAYFTGIDIGSTIIKIAVSGSFGELVCSDSAPTGSHFNKNTQDLLDRLLVENNLSDDDIKYTVTTGYGRKLFKTGDDNVNELTANAIGATHLLNNGIRIRTIINVGGQDTKIIRMDDKGNISNFVMNDKCAAGTGRFLEIAARNLEVDVSELGNMHYEAREEPLPINSTCAVFAESEIISLLAAGHKPTEIVSGLHYSIARRITRLASRSKVEDGVLFDGGTALNKGMVDALEVELMRKIYVAENPQFTTAYGASLMAAKKYKSELAVQAKNKSQSTT